MNSDDGLAKQEVQEVQEEEDPLLCRLQDKYRKQRSEQLASRRKRLERELNTQAAKNSTLPPSVELLSDEAIHAFNDLEKQLIALPGARQAVDQLRAIRTLVNQELRQSLSYLEDGYASGFQTLLSEAQLTKHLHASPDDDQHRTNATTKVPLSEAPVPCGTVQGTPDRSLMEQCPAEWRMATKMAVVEEMSYQAAHTVKQLPRRFTAQEALSCVTSLYAESLAVLLSCEVVRIYLYDDNGNLHCCATFPSTAGDRGDPMRATYTEIMLAKELHHSVCARGIAVNGSEAQYNMLSKRDVELIHEEVESSGWGSMRSCLIFPIPYHKGVEEGSGGEAGKGRRSAGMIHAVNKASVSASQAGRFSTDDEVLLSIGARVLGGILTQHPMHFFTVRMDAAVRKATHPHEGPPGPTDHLPRPPQDVVEDANLVGMKALLSPQPMMILRAPISDIYQSRTRRSRNRKLGNLVANDSALTSVEFNLTALNALWETGMADNVRMHQQYRALNEQTANTKLLMRNLLDGLAVARTMHAADDMARYLQKLELFARNENNELLSEFISHALLASHSAAPGGEGCGSTKEREPVSALEPPGRGTSTALEVTDSPTKLSTSTAQHRHLSATVPTSTTQTPPFHVPLNVDSLATPSAPTAEDDPFLDDTAATTLARHLTRLNATVASQIHTDGPDGVCAYSSDPVSKREQVRYIEQVQQKRLAAVRTHLAHTDARPAAAHTVHAATVPPRPQLGERGLAPSARLSTKHDTPSVATDADWRRKRRFKL